MRKYGYSAIVNTDGSVKINKEEKRMSKGKKIGIFAGVAALLSAIGAGIWYFLRNPVEEPEDFYEDSEDGYDEDPDDIDDVEIENF